ncbi:2-isopropylmalate synthase (Alpha-isopropylmalate synthase) (Alpha-IPM synthetase) [Elasticomyces elasticus]|uniref:2-isopropylmalate synthase (Alpha-isopropylmalate synthase) (Alpha-IPM synthetase) n=1 Tax=Exophiala sideris TaxID=1016849 RepID=A0ABR0J5Y6_9EURO|nr:2-isopropylmalate synthase (Alpha-isopropylmalate synthase) (Alpha-IPM synthetase) [Elasticomyces elasticus]KAK5028425.1 2-isopropylmalate synthase (Alpha-isopropylmalate synthase) (Alpha-IPM synthetase) [Exophiala sideris]KAK5035932.1 2-isopropylmalate synthase (Alpha-isopropylmalate synthase) (Alpha-IPM synthetase) [Exophiala sideris]KAK5056968.1 2-isopropylmalate synthase (Alpha-isopropylmalate synthase) (Alpha-IPM synthetase) [Exophiala sideris]KAK5181375.1 2-isopropylmalate synthase (Al
MRYQSWDVLLFPGDSRVPIQEFDTKCYAIDQNIRVPALSPVNDINPNKFESITLTPILTCFVASLERGSSFRVSIHSWEQPKPSHILLSYKTPEEAVLFEARVYIDGILMAQQTFEDGVWPEVIGDKGKAHRLRFPKFHREILQQPTWEPSDPVGRIRVVISEGVLRETSPPAAPDVMFDRLRDVVAFSFQHAPQNILEYSGIAWPNPALFGKASKRSMRPPPIGDRLPPVSGHEAHSHSPNRTVTAVRSGRPSSKGVDSFQKRLNAQTFSDVQSDPVNKLTAFQSMRKCSPESGDSAEGEDPFLCPPRTSTQQWRLQLRSSSHDVPMPDYKTDNSASYTAMSEISFPRASFLKHMNQANPTEIVQALSPARQEELLKALSVSQSPARGTDAPANTPCSAWEDNRAHSCADEEQDVLSSHRQSPPTSRIPVDIVGDYSLALLGARSKSLNTIRQRSISNPTKRKHESLSPSYGIGTAKETIPVVVDSPSASSGKDSIAGSTHATPSGDRIPLLVE